MKKIALFLMMFVLTSTFAQVEFEDGYLIDNSGKETECFIKYVDWKYNPTQIEYRMSDNAPVKVATIDSIQEFGINNKAKYKRFLVKIDRSSNDPNFMSDHRKPDYKYETLFLKTLVEGKATLYEYVDSLIRKYFISVDNNDAEQLLYKEYLIDSRIGKNEYYKQQIYNKLSCKNITKSDIANLNYKQEDLIDIFTKYNNCINGKSVDYNKNKYKNPIKFYFTAGLQSSSLAIRNYKSWTNKGADFKNKIGFKIGFDVEYILPYNKNKWRLFIAPSYYQQYADRSVTTNTHYTGNKLITNVEYTHIEIPAGIRYYFFLNKHSRIFLNTAYAYNKSLSSIIWRERADGTVIDNSVLETGNSFGWIFGAGYGYRRYSVELRINDGINILPNYVNWDSKYIISSLTFSYRVN